MTGQVIYPYPYIRKRHILRSLIYFHFRNWNNRSFERLFYAFVFQVKSIECTLTYIWLLHFRFKAERAITKSMLVIQRDENKWPGKYSKVNNHGTSTKHELQTRVSAGSELSHTSTTWSNYIPLQLSSSSSNSNNHGMSTVYNESTQEVRFSILQSSNSVVWNTITRHFLWSILYVIYNSYLRLLIWGRNGLMNFVLICWLLFLCFFTECNEILANVQLIPDPLVPRA